MDINHRVQEAGSSMPERGSEPTSDAPSCIQDAIAEKIDGAIEAIDHATIFRSRRFLDVLRTMDQRQQEHAIGAMLQYTILHPDSFEFFETLEQLKNVPASMGGFDRDGISKVFSDTVLRKLNISPSNADDLASREAVADYCVERFKRNGKYFHGFNGAFEGRIRTQGLTTDQREWQWDDLKRVHEICDHAGKSMVLGWSQLNSEGRLSVSQSPTDSYSYATCSPEWCGYFIGQATDDPMAKTAFKRRDYRAARTNIESLCNELMSETRGANIITTDEREEILVFFEKYWERFAGSSSGPKVAIIDQEAVDRRKMPDWECAFVKEQYMNDKDSVSRIVGLNLWSMVNDKQIKHSIAPEHFRIINLPDYDDVFPSHA